jgi:RecJ OB domain
VVGNRHLRLRLRAASGEAVDAIAFRYLDGADAPELRTNDRVQAVYRTGVDDYTGTRKLQLVTEWVGKL